MASSLYYMVWTADHYPDGVFKRLRNNLPKATDFLVKRESVNNEGGKEGSRWTVEFSLPDKDGKIMKCILWTRQKKLATFADLESAADYLAERGVTDFKVKQPKKVR